MTSIQLHPRHHPVGHSSLPSTIASSLRLGASSRWGGAGGLLLAVLAAGTGCPSPDAEGKFERFNEQTEDDREIPEAKMDLGAPVLPDMGATGSDTETSGGGLLVEGVYLVAVNTIVSPGLPLQFLAEVTGEVDLMGNGSITVDFQPLSLDQGSTTLPREEVGDSLLIEGEVANFGFTLPFPEPTMVTGAANPLTGSDISSNLSLEGSFRSEDAWCGNVLGMVLSPIQVPLDGSTFSATRLADRAERPLHFSCECATVDLEPGATEPEGCILLPM